MLCTPLSTRCKPSPAVGVPCEHVALRCVQAVRQLGLEGVLVLEALPNTPAYDAGLRSTYRCAACALDSELNRFERKVTFRGNSWRDTDKGCNVMRLTTSCTGEHSARADGCMVTGSCVTQGRFGAAGAGGHHHGPEWQAHQAAEGPVRHPGRLQGACTLFQQLQIESARSCTGWDRQLSRACVICIGSWRLTAAGCS